MNDSYTVHRFTLEEAARCIVHRQTGKAISPVSLRAWIMQARQANRPFPDERMLQKSGVAHSLTIAQIELLLTGRPYQFEQSNQVSTLSEDAAEMRQLEEKLHALQKEYQSLIELWHQMQTLEPATVEDTNPRREGNLFARQLGEKSERALRENWVGRSRSHGYFALFIHLYIAHGLGKRGAAHRGEKVKQDIQLGLAPRYPVTVILGGAKGSGDQLVVTEQQATQNIINYHLEMYRKTGGQPMPETILCLDPRCPVCPHVEQRVIETLSNVQESQE